MQILCRALQEAQDIFGVDVDLDDFDRLSDEYDDDDQDEDVCKLCKILFVYINKALMQDFAGVIGAQLHLLAIYSMCTFA